MAFFSANDADFLTVLSVFVVSMVSGFISIAQRIARGAAVSTLWLACEFSAALLAGYLMWDAYPHIKHLLWGWLTMPIAVAGAAHFGGRGLQLFEKLVYKRLDIPTPEDGPNS